MNRLGCALAFAGLLLGQASGLTPGLMTAEGHWIGWQCSRGLGTPQCELRRLGAQGVTLATADSSGTGIWPGPLALSADRQTVYSTGERLAARDARTLKLRWTAPLALPNLTGGGDSASVAVSPDGGVLAVAAKAGDVAVRHARSGRLQQTLPHPGPRPVGQDDEWNTSWYRAVTALAYDPSSRRLAIGSRGGGLRLRDLTTGEERVLSGHCGKPQPTAHRGPVVGLVWTSPNVLVSAANDETLRRWDTTTGRERECLSTPGGTRVLQRLSGGRLLALGATSATLVDGRAFRRVAYLGPLAGELSELSVLGNTVHLFDGFRERRWNATSGKEVNLHGQPFATLEQEGVRVTVRPDMRVAVTRGGRTQVLAPPAVPPFNLGGWGYPNGWTLERSGPVLTVTASSTVRILTMETADFFNVFRWNVDTGRLERCDTTGTGISERDRACPDVQQSR